MQKPLSHIPRAGRARDSFAVCLTARETVSDLRRFIDHCRDAEAAHIYLYFDGTNDEAQDVCTVWGQDPFVTITVCDPAFWQSALPDVTAPALEEKQIATCMMAIEKNQSDWLLFCDADEFLAADIPIGEVLAQVPDSQPGVRVRNTEAVWGVSDDITQEFGCGYERRPARNSVIGKYILPYLVFGPDGRVMSRCTAGYTAGKHLLRRGVVPEQMTCHKSRVNGRRLEFLHDLLPDDAHTRVVHFDAIGSDRWHRKWQSRISGATVAANMGASRRRQAEQIAQAFQQGKSEHAFRRLYGLTRWQQFILTRLGLLTRIWS